MSQRTWLSFIIATLAALVLVFSSFWMRQYHCVALQEMLQPVSHAFCRRQQETFLAKHTAPSKLAVATSEDLPQAMLQSLFVIIYGGSNTQFVFIGISCAKIATSATIPKDFCFLISAQLWNVRKIISKTNMVINRQLEYPTFLMSWVLEFYRILQLVTCTVRMFQEDLTYVYTA